MNILISRIDTDRLSIRRHLNLLVFFVFSVVLNVQGAGDYTLSKHDNGVLTVQQGLDQQLFKVDTGGGILPLHNFSLTVTLKENIVFLKWIAENEMNTEKFIVQRSMDGFTFKNIGELPPSGPINILTEYNSVDDLQGLTSNVVYYRIKAEDNRSYFAYSNVVPVRLTKSAGFSFWPNPFTTSLNLSYNSTTSASIRVEMFDNGGRRVLQQLFNINRGVNQLSVNGASGLSHGLYHIRIIDLQTNEVSTVKIAK